MSLINQKLRKKLIELHDSTSSSIPLAGHLSELLHVSKSTAYGKLNGHSSFSTREIEIIVDYFNIAPTDLFTEKGTPNRGEGNVRSYVNYILSLWYDQLLNLSKRQQPEVFIISNSLPLSLAFHYPNLITYRVFHMLQYLHHDPPSQLNLSDPTYNDIGSYCKKIAMIYDLLPINEIWGSNIFCIGLKHWYQLINSKQMPSLEDYNSLVSDLESIVQLSKKYTENGVRQPKYGDHIQTVLPSYRILFNDTMVLQEYTILAWQEHSQQQLLINHPIRGVINTQSCKSKVERYFMYLERHSNEISIVNKVGRNVLYDKIEKEIAKYKMSDGRN